MGWLFKTPEEKMQKQREIEADKQVVRNSLVTKDVLNRIDYCFEDNGDKNLLYYLRENNTIRIAVDKERVTAQISFERPLKDSSGEEVYGTAMNIIVFAKQGYADLKNKVMVKELDSIIQEHLRQIPTIRVEGNIIKAIKYEW